MDQQEIEFLDQLLWDGGLVVGLLLSPIAKRTSENLAKHHGGHGREQGDPQGGEGILALGHRHAGHHTGAEAGHRELGGEIAAGTGGGVGEHGGPGGWLRP